jgi:predicted transcriptional regulator
MQQKQYIWVMGLFGILSLTLTTGELLKENSQTSSINDKMTSMNSSVAKVEDLNFTEIVQSCNETYMIAKNYLEELNETGSFPDETEEAPMVKKFKYSRKTPHS